MSGITELFSNSSYSSPRIKIVKGIQLYLQLVTLNIKFILKTNMFSHIVDVSKPNMEEYLVCQKWLARHNWSDYKIYKSYTKSLVPTISYKKQNFKIIDNLCSTLAWGEGPAIARSESLLDWVAQNPINLNGDHLCDEYSKAYKQQTDNTTKHFLTQPSISIHLNHTYQQNNCGVNIHTFVISSKCCQLFGCLNWFQLCTWDLPFRLSYCAVWQNCSQFL